MRTRNADEPTQVTNVTINVLVGDSRALAMSADLGVNVAAQVLDVHHERARIGAGVTR